MVDISNTIAAKSDQLNAADLFGGPITVKVIDVKVTAGDQPVSIVIEGHQPYKPCLSMRRILAKLWGPESGHWIGKSMTLYCDDAVIWAGKPVGGIRIAALQGLAKSEKVPIRESKHKVVQYEIEPLTIRKPSYSDSDIEKNSAAWIKAFKNGGTTPDKLINKMQQEMTLTDQQIETIKKLGVSE